MPNLEPRERLKKLRKSLSLSQRELAAEFKVSAAAVNQWEKGIREIPGPVLKLMEVYEESLGFAPEAGDRDEIRRLSSLWSERILALLRHDSSGPLRRRLQVGLRKYLTEELPRGDIARRVRIELLHRVIGAVGLAKGLPMKALHLLSYMNPTLSEDVRNAILDLNFNSPAIAPTVVARILHEEFGKSPRELFAKWNPRPFAKASIGQVHEATLHSGERVAVKVQYPEVAESIRSDFRIFLFMNDIASLLRPENRQIAHELSNTILGECDYEQEARYQMSFREVLKNEPDIWIPKVFPEYSSRRVLTSEYVEGDTLDRFLARATDTEKAKASRALWKFNALTPFRHALMHADFHAANFLFTKDRVAFLDYGRVIPLEPKSMEQHRKMVLSLIRRNKETALEAIRALDFIKDWDAFDFDEFWETSLAQQAHLASNGPFEMTREHIQNHQKASRAFSNPANFKLSADLLWSTCMCYGLWSLLADLKANENWGELTLEFFGERA